MTLVLRVVSKKDTGVTTNVTTDTTTAVSVVSVVAIVGSRNYHNYDNLKQYVDQWIKVNGPIKTIVSGGAKGVDTLARRYATEHNINLVEFYPDWSTYGEAAGMIRNTDIINHATHVIAFPSRNGKGTQDSIRKSLKQGKPIYAYYID